MIYILGMSHAINVLKAASRVPLTFTHENWSEMASASQFFDIEAKPGLIVGDTLKAFLVHPSLGWGMMAKLNTLPDGQRQVIAVDGFIGLLRSIESAQENNCLFSMVLGNEHSHLVQHAVPYDFYLPWNQNLELLPDTQPVAYEIIRRQMEQALSYQIACVAIMRTLLPNLRLVHVLPPPPIESEIQLLKTPEIFGEQLTRFGITPFSIRLKYYLLAVDILRQALNPFGVELLEAPPEAVSANGGLKDEYVYGATHANEAYGELVIKQMQALVSNKG